MCTSEMNVLAEVDTLSLSPSEPKSYTHLHQQSATSKDMKRSGVPAHSQDRDLNPARQRRNSNSKMDDFQLLD